MLLPACRGSGLLAPAKRAGRTHLHCTVARNVLLVPPALADGALWAEAPCAEPVRPAPAPNGHAATPEKPNAGRVTPTKLSALSTVLRLPVTRVETLLQSSPPAVRQLSPEDVAARLSDLSATLGISPKQAAFMVSKQPACLLLTPLDRLSTKVDELASALGVPRGAVIRAALTIPSILARTTEAVVSRVKAYGTLLRCGPVDVLHVMARGPEYLTDTPSSVKARMVALGCVLRRPRCTIAAMLQARPDLVFMAPRVMNTKVNGIMCILNKEKRHVVTLVVRHPALLRCDLNNVRAVFEGLQSMLRKKEGFAYAMVCHAPRLLLMTPRGLHQRASALRRCLAASPEWAEEFAQLRPPHVAQLLLNRQGSLSSMMYLSERRRAGRVSLARLLEEEQAAALGEAWPDFLTWMERRQRVMEQRAQQRQAAEARSSALAAGLSPAAAAAAATAAVVGSSVWAGRQGLHPHPQQRPGPSHASLAASPLASQALSPVSSESHADWQANGAAAAASAGASGHVLAADAHAAVGPSAASAAQVQHSARQLSDATASASSSGSYSISGNGTSSSSRSGGTDPASSSGSSPERNDSAAADAEASAGTPQRSQQQEASTSGRQLSWLQLQAEYRRTLLRARGDAAGAAAKDGRQGRRTARNVARASGITAAPGFRGRTAATAKRRGAVSSSGGAAPLPSPSTTAPGSSAGGPRASPFANGARRRFSRTQPLTHSPRSAADADAAQLIGATQHASVSLPPLPAFRANGHAAAPSHHLPTPPGAGEVPAHLLGGLRLPVDGSDVLGGANGNGGADPVSHSLPSLEHAVHRPAHGEAFDDPTVLSNQALPMWLHHVHGANGNGANGNGANGSGANGNGANGRASNGAARASPFAGTAAERGRQRSHEAQAFPSAAATIVARQQFARGHDAAVGEEGHGLDGQHGDSVVVLGGDGAMHEIGAGARQRRGASMPGQEGDRQCSGLGQGQGQAQGQKLEPALGAAAPR
ncbi:hypothetical protein HYH03_003182 [Edaphochlamys debaryana]|uniref:Uncharacterized protein n=1 Tax=Edaphochlamys debaryana TaxID=47281 RepID=A0A835YDR6_9CHLO|nr:hypothetical protein HYH03_003182 [Edaphochlamys debaryana]|eukprot:KAG2498996.1 hypothetical protein HYH03_003182 [Edaphochlamys debaryana]